jgi:adenosylcobinamide kinase/adenosylcobinamide-phosphate guanylyltransferase
MILGGCRSGKSSYAHKLASEYKQVAYLATATAGDAELQQRIDHHRRERPRHWLTIEEPLELAPALKDLDDKVEAVIVDCLTLYLNNLISALGVDADDISGYSQYEDQINNKLDEIINAAKEIKPAVLVVTNELGTGLVPPDAQSRFFRDMMGLMNQRLARAADEVYKLEVGIAVRLKQAYEAGL